MKITDRFNRAIHPLMLRYVRHQYQKKIRMVRATHPESFGKASKGCLKRHGDLWGRLAGSVDPTWLDLFCGVSGKEDFRFVPEDVFYGVIERCLNNCEYNGAGVGDKSDGLFYMPPKYHPQTIIRFVRGVWFGHDLSPISRERAEQVLSDVRHDVVGKPTMKSCGGSNVLRFKAADGGLINGNLRLSADWIEENFEGYVVQERIRQEPEAASFNPASLNTCRLMSFRRPWSGETTVIGGMMRFGVTSAIIDNIAHGGICSDIGPDGELGPFAVDYKFGKVFEHPVSKKPFAGFRIPFYREMCEAVCEVARSVPGFNLLSFDVVARPDGTPCIIEINDASMTLSQLQTRRPLFGDETERLVDWCVAHRAKYDVFNHVRTWY